MTTDLLQISHWRLRFRTTLRRLQRRFRAVVSAREDARVRQAANDRTWLAKVRLCRLCGDTVTWDSEVEVCQDCWAEMSGRHNGYKQLSGKATRGRRSGHIASDAHSGGPVGRMGHRGVSEAFFDDIVKASEEDR